MDSPLTLPGSALPGMSGLELLKRVRAEHPQTVTIVVTAYGTVTSAVDAMKAGAYDYVMKPVHSYELKVLVDRVLENKRLVEEVQNLRSSIDQKLGFESNVGHLRKH